MDNINSFIISKMDEADAREIILWRYDPPYDTYNCDPDEMNAGIQWFLKPEFHYYSARDTDRELIGFLCFGADAQVRGGDYSTDALDVGGGLRPDRTGIGLGTDFITAGFELARRRFSPPVFRATVAAFNIRALRVCEKAGFSQIQTFQQPETKQSYIVLMRDADD